MTEKPILFSGPMVRAILDGRKTQTRRVIKDLLACYDLSADSIRVIHNDRETIERRGASIHTSIALRRLHGRKRWSDLLTDQICRLWAEGARGLVSVEGSCNTKRLPYRIFMPPQQEGNEIGASSCLHGVSRDTKAKVTAGSPLGRVERQQPTEQLEVGNSGRELAGPKSPREWYRGRETSCSEADRLRASINTLAGLKGDCQPTSGGPLLEDVTSSDLFCLPHFVGQRKWVRETFCRDLDRTLCYRADEVPYHAELTRWKSPRYMPRKYCRLLLDVKAVRVERLQDISEADAKAEGLQDWYPPASMKNPRPAHTSVARYANLWDSLNENRGFGWKENPWVWVIEFERANK